MLVSFRYRRNPIMGQLTAALATADKTAIKFLEGIVKKIVARIRKIKAKIQPTLDKVDMFATRLLSFGKTAVQVAGALLQGESVSNVSSMVQQNINAMPGGNMILAKLMTKLLNFKAWADVALEKLRNSNTMTTIMAIFDKVKSFIVF